MPFCHSSRPIQVPVSLMECLMPGRTPPFRRATPDDAPALEALQQRSAAHWGYPADHFDWAPGSLTIPPAYILDNPVYILQRDGQPVGFYGLAKEDGLLLLDKLIVEADQMGKGYGRLLWRHAIEIARSLGYQSFDIGADPMAAPFYRAMGAEPIGSRQTANPDWTVELFRYVLPELVIRSATVNDAENLHALTQRSVMYWGYPAEFLAWEPDSIAVTPEFLARATSAVLEIGGVVTGYYSLVAKADGLYLDKLFVDPTWIGTGLGKRLWLHALDQARRLGATTLKIESDPNAAPFYAAMGARHTGEIEMDWPGWNLQVFEFPLGQSDMTVGREAAM